MSNASKLSFNDTTSDIIDIDFDQYNEETETPTEKIDGAEDSDDSFNRSRVLISIYVFGWLQLHQEKMSFNVQ